MADVNPDFNWIVSMERRHNSHYYFKTTDGYSDANLGAALTLYTQWKPVKSVADCIELLVWFPFGYTWFHVPEEFKTIPEVELMYKLIDDRDYDLS
jgi:hypothetical protein